MLIVIKDETYFLHVNVLSTDLVVALQADFINWVIIIKLNKAETSLLAGFLVGNNANRVDATIALEVHPKIIFLMVILETTNEQLLHSSTSLWPANFLPWYSTLGLHNTAIDSVWSTKLPKFN